MNRDGLLGRPRVGERLLPVAIAALDAGFTVRFGGGSDGLSRAERVNLPASTITWRWPVICPKCGLRPRGMGAEAQGNSWPGAAGVRGACTWRDVQLQRAPVVLLGWTHASCLPE